MMLIAFRLVYFYMYEKSILSLKDIRLQILQITSFSYKTEDEKFLVFCFVQMKETSNFLTKYLKMIVYTNLYYFSLQKEIVIVLIGNISIK